MVFSCVSADLDPSKWQHPQYQQEGFIWSTLHHGNNIIINPNNSTPLLLPPHPPPPTIGPMGGPGPTTRPISMAELARRSNTPKPPASVKCPRCESTNTKFCYYNNRSLSQPRHWCRSCRRHWTDGGTLRNVPIGGARRKTKRSKSSSGASSAASLAPTPVLGLSDYYGRSSGGIPAPPELPPDFRFELEAELSSFDSFEIGHVIGSRELEEIGQVDDEFGNEYIN